MKNTNVTLLPKYNITNHDIYSKIYLLKNTNKYYFYSQILAP